MEEVPESEEEDDYQVTVCEALFGEEDYYDEEG